MPILLTYDSPVLGIWKITEPWQDMMESLRYNSLYCRDANNIQSDKRKQEWLAVRLLLKHLSGADTFIDYHDNGAPFLQNSQNHISISHTTGYAAIILSKNQNPGIDIEYRSERAWKLRKKFLSDKESDIFLSLNHPDLSIQSFNEYSINTEPVPCRSDLSTLCWCAKETTFKALQQTEVDFIEHLHILPFTLSDEGFLAIKETKTPRQQIFIINYKIADNYIITWKA